jgi:cytochrome c2
MRLTLLITILVICATAASAVVAHRIQRAEITARARDLTGGNPAHGKALARDLGCTACHVIPGVRGPRSRVAPPLDDFGLRQYVAGATRNTPDHLVRFLQDPRSVAPKTAMPNLRVSESDARDLAAYLYAQR